MTDRSKELVSAFLDDELTPEELQELCEALDRRPELASTLQSYAVIGGAMRKEFCAPRPALSRKVRAKVVPYATRCTETGLPPNVIPMPARAGEEPVADAVRNAPVPVAAGAPRGKGLRAPLRWRRAVGSLALAASVAVAVVGGLRLLNDGLTGETAAPALASGTSATTATLAATPSLGEQRKPNVVTVGSPGRADLRWSVEQRAIEQRLNAYLVQHNEVLRHGVRGMLPYARIVGYKPSNAN